MELLPIEVQSDHLVKLTKSSPFEAIEELIWNALDADAQIITVTIKESGTDTPKCIIIEDDGHGISARDFKQAFGDLGNSLKKNKVLSPQSRVLHGKEGKGRFKAFALGDLITFRSYFVSEEILKQIQILWDINDIKHPKYQLSSESDTSALTKTGTVIQIQNCKPKMISKLTERDYLPLIDYLGPRFVLYQRIYGNIKITINGNEVDFSTQIEAEQTDSFSFTAPDGRVINGELRAILWKEKNTSNKMYVCNANEFVVFEDHLNLRNTQGLGVSVFLTTNYVENKHADLLKMDETFNYVLNQLKERAKEFLNAQLTNRRKEFINKLKNENVYPPNLLNIDEEDLIKKQEKEVFDLVAYVSVADGKFSKKKPDDKRAHLELIRLGIENGDEALHKILTEVIKLPNAKVQELSEVLGRINLSHLIETAKMVTQRLDLIHELRAMFSDKIGKKIKERSQFHKIIVDNTWLFGEEYALGTSDQTLKNVLKSHLKYLGREDFEATLQESDNTHLKKIPDICLFSQIPQGSDEKNLNLVIELKRPSARITRTELNQVEDYAIKVAEDGRFPKRHTEWVFFLMAGNEIDDFVKQKINQVNREPGVFYHGERVICKLVSWFDLLHDAEARHRFLQKKLNLTLEENPEQLNFIKEKYNDLFVS